MQERIKEDKKGQIASMVLKNLGALCKTNKRTAKKSVSVGINFGYSVSLAFIDKGKILCYY